MKLVTNDYGCGTSSSILDYGIDDVVIVSENNYHHLFDVEDDLLFIGHDFLFYLWDSEEKIKRWMSRKDKFEHWVWCFERIDAIVPAWQQKSHLSLSIATKFCNRVLACDEDDCDKYGLDWLPQWASSKFYKMKDEVIPSREKILFSGQAGNPEYHARNILLQSLTSDSELSSMIDITNVKRSLSWEDYVRNLLSYKMVLNPVGILKGLNTRAYESIYSGRLLLQQTVGDYKRHKKLLEDCPGVFFFQNISDLKKLLNKDLSFTPTDASYTNHSLYARMKSIGVNL